MKEHNVFNLEKNELTRRQTLDSSLYTEASQAYYLSFLKSKKQNNGFNIQKDSMLGKGS